MVRKKLCFRMDKWVSGPADLIFISQPDLTWERSPGFASAELHLSVERTAEATDPLHLQGFSYGKESGRESRPGPCFLFTAEPLCSRGSSVISYLHGHIPMSNVRGAQGTEGLGILFPRGTTVDMSVHSHHPSPGQLSHTPKLSPGD